MRSWSPAMEAIYPVGQSPCSAEGSACQISLLLTLVSWAENSCRFLRAVFSQKQSYDGQRTSKLSSWRKRLTALPSSCHSTDSRAIATAVRVDSSTQGKTRLPSNPLLFTPVSCAKCIDSISYFLNHKTRCAPSWPIYRDWIHAI